MESGSVTPILSCSLLVEREGFGSLIIFKLLHGLVQLPVWNLTNWEVAHNPDLTDVRWGSGVHDRDPHRSPTGGWARGGEARERLSTFLR